ncbi:MAG: ATP-binding protein [Erysipelotrichaceae bacterium]|nr:ATP-binding protein [Erysipelotrichaceae bacterium]
MNYLNIEDPVYRFERHVNNNIYVDKTMMIDIVSRYIDKSDFSYICVTRPRRFGKTYNANMLAAYYTKGYDTKNIFDKLKISQTDDYLKHLNKYNVLYIDFSDMNDRCSSYDEYITNIKQNIKSDLESEYHIDVSLEAPISAAFRQTKDSFVLILDECDSIFYKSFMSEQDCISYMEFLKNLIKDKLSVRLAYMTGILPIVKYSSGSALNNFSEFNFINDRRYDEFFGFTEDEVKSLCIQYPQLKYEDLEYWYDGYYTSTGKKLFNPRSVSSAFDRCYCGNYWTSTGPMSEIADCIEDNVDDVRDDIVQLVAGVPVEIELMEYLEKDDNLDIRDEILSSMVIFGFLTYRDGYLYIPNHELMLKFEKILNRKDMGEYNEIVKQSKLILKATQEENEELLANMIEEAHDKEIDLFHYNDENSLACLLTVCYIYARKYYRIKREEATGKGRCDMIFVPQRSHIPAIIIELKVNGTPHEAIDQIINKNYVDKVKDCKEILLVGISYNSNSEHAEYKKHHVKIEEYKK